MNNSNNSSNEKQETQSAKNLVSKHPVSSQKDSTILGDVNKAISQKKSKSGLLKKVSGNKPLVIIAIIALVFSALIVIYFISSSLDKKQAYDQEINEVAAYIPVNGEEPRSTDVANNSIQNLKNSDLSKSKNKDDLDVYYNSLYAFYIEANNCSAAVDTYNKEVKPKKVLLNDLQILWLIDCVQVTSAEGTNMLNDAKSYLEEALKNADQDDKQALTNRLETINNRAKLWQN